MNLFETFIKIGIDSSDVGKGISSLKDDMFTLGDAIKANLISDVIKDGISFVINGLEQMEKAALGFAKDSLDAAVSYESAFAGVRKTVDVTEEEYGQLSDWIKKASTEMAASQEEIAGTMEISGQLGVTGIKNLENFTETMIMLGTSTNLSSEEAASALARILNITEGTYENIDKVGAVVVALGNNFATTESDITNMATRLASTGKIAGLTTTDIFALATGMSSVGIEAEAGGTAMSQTITAISKAVSGATGDTKELEKAQGKVTKATEALEKAQEKYNKALAESGEDSSKAKTALNNLEKAQITYNAAVEKYGKESNQAQKALQGVENAQIKYDDVLSKSSDKVAEAAKGVEKAEADLATAQQGLEAASSGAGGSLDLIAKVSKMSAEEFAEAWKNEPMEALKAFIGGLGDLENTGLDVNNVLDELKMDGVRQGNMLKSLSLATEQLTSAQELANRAYEENSALTEEAGKRNETAAAQSEMVANAFKNIQIAIGEGMEPTFVEFLGIVKNGFIEMTEAFGTEGSEGGFVGLFNKAGELFDNILNFAMEKMPEFGAVASQIIENMVTTFGQRLPDVVKAAESILGSIVDYIGSHLDDIGNVAGQIVNSIATFIMSHVEDLQKAAGWIVDNLTKALDDTAKKIAEFDWKQAAHDLGENLKSAVTGEGGPSLIEVAAELISNLATGIGQAAPELIPAAIETVTSLANDLIEQLPMLMDAAFDLIIGLAEGLTDPNSIGSIMDAALNLITSFADGLLNNIPKIMDAIPTIIYNIVIGFAQNAPKLIEAGGESLAAFVEGLIKSIPYLVAQLPEIITALALGIIDLSFHLVEAGQNVMEALWEGISAADTGEWGRDMIQGFVDGIADSIDMVRDVVSDVADTVKDILGFSEPKKGPLSNFHTYAPDMMHLFAKGVKDNTDEVRKQIEESFDFGNLIEDQAYDFSGSIDGKFTGYAGMNNGGGITGGYVQNLTINAPTELSPSEIARQTKNANREFVLSMRMA